MNTPLPAIGVAEAPSKNTCPAVHPSVRSWHSHHPNGLRHLSAGDLNSYYQDVNDPNFRLDFFLVSLALDYKGFERARHFLFQRNCQQYYEIDPSLIEISEEATPYQSILSVVQT